MSAIKEMADLKANEGAIYPQMRIAQMDAGELAIETMAFNSGTTVRFCHQIFVRSASSKNEGWGDIIFAGSLKELIERIKQGGVDKEIRADNK